MNFGDHVVEHLDLRDEATVLGELYLFAVHALLDVGLVFVAEPAVLARVNVAALVHDTFFF